MLRHEHPPTYLSDTEPTVNDLMDYTQANLATKALTRYFFTRNPGRAVKRHEKLGTPLVREVAMGTVGRFASRNHHGWSNYRLDKSRAPIDAAMRFAVSGTVFNEVIHTAAAAQNISLIAADVMTQTDHLTATGATGIGALILNTSLIALQRYNRARMLQRINDKLQSGESFNSRDTNWTGIDYRAERAFDEAHYDSSMGTAPTR